MGQRGGKVPGTCFISATSFLSCLHKLVMQISTAVRIHQQCRPVGLSAVLIALGGFLYKAFSKIFVSSIRRFYQAMPSGTTCSYTGMHNKFHREETMSSHNADTQRHSCELRIRRIQRCGKCQARLGQFCRHSQFLSYLTGVSAIYSRDQTSAVFHYCNGHRPLISIKSNVES